MSAVEESGWAVGCLGAHPPGRRLVTAGAQRIYDFCGVERRKCTRSTAIGPATVIRMELPPDTVLIFDRDEELLVFASFVHATNWVEAMDIDEGEYTAVYSPHGGVLALTAPEGPEGPVVLTRTGSVDLGDLERRVARYWRRHQTGQLPRDPLQTARFLIERDNKPRGGWLGRVTGLLRRDTAEAEPTPSPRDDFTARGDAGQ